MAADPYKQSILQWREEMDAGLRRENSWLALAGLFWLKQGKNTVGSDPSSDVLLPERAPRSLGYFKFDGEKVRLHVNKGQRVEVNGKAIRQAALKTDHEKTPSFITLDKLQMLVVRRPHGTGIRLWDNQRPQRQNFPTRAWFAVNKNYCLPARYTHHAAPKKVLMPDTFGELQEITMDGSLSFEFEGETYQLEVSELDDHRLFIQFKDLTGGLDTYPAGRYLYTDAIVDGKVTLDFNKAYSPPCAFTDFATCLFAPKENHLNLHIEAGEIYPGHF